MFAGCRIGRVWDISVNKYKYIYIYICICIRFSELNFKVSGFGVLGVGLVTP